MKKLYLLTVITLVLSIGIGWSATVKWSILPASYPDVTHPEFGTVRDSMLTALSMGLTPTTSTRVGNLTGVEIRDVFETGDMCVSTSPTALWRGQLNPPAPYNGMTGQRIYGTTVGIADGGQVSLSRVSYRVLCDRIPALNNQSSFAGQTYSVSRIGILKGPDGKLFTADDVILKDGQPGTTMVDALALIGGRIGALVNTESDVQSVDAALTANSSTVTFEYYLDSAMSGSSTVMLYPRGKTPVRKYGTKLFWMPNGALFSVVGPAGMTPFEFQWSREITGPWMVASSTATEGSSVFVPYLDSLGASQRGFARGPVFAVSVAPTARAVALLDGQAIVSAHSFDGDQDVQ